MDVITSVLSADGTKQGIFVEVNDFFTGLHDSRFCSNRYSSRSYGKNILLKHQELDATKSWYFIVGNKYHFCLQVGKSSFNSVNILKMEVC